MLTIYTATPAPGSCQAHQGHGCPATVSWHHHDHLDAWIPVHSHYHVQGTEPEHLFPAGGSPHWQAVAHVTEHITF